MQTPDAGVLARPDYEPIPCRDSVGPTSEPIMEAAFPRQVQCLEADHGCHTTLCFCIQWAPWTVSVADRLCRFPDSLVITRTIHVLWMVSPGSFVGPASFHALSPCVLASRRLHAYITPRIPPLGPAGSSTSQ